MSRAIEELRNTQPVQALLEMPIPTIKIPDQLPESTISKASLVEPRFSPSKPTLAPPNALADTCLLVEKADKASDRWSRYKEGTIQTELDKIQRYQQEEAILLEKAANASRDVTFWGILEDVGNTITGSISLYLGSIALSAPGGTAVGGLLITSGVLSIGNVAFKYGQIWDWVADQTAQNNKQLHQAIKTYIPSAIGIVAAAMSIYGSYSAWQYAAGSGTQQVQPILHAITSVATGLTNFAKGLSEGRLHTSTGDLLALHSNTQLSIMDLENFSEELKQFLQKQSQWNGVMSKILESWNEQCKIAQYNPV